jgi:sugar phosphate isomerase/epimerase
LPRLATIAAFGFPAFNPPTLLPIYRRLGCRTGQYYRNTANPPDPADARRIAQDAGLPFDSIHGVFGADFDPSSPDEAVRRAAVQTYIREGELALGLGGPMVVIHPGPPAAKNAEITPALRAARVAPFEKTLADLAREADRLGVTYLFENIPPNYLFGSDPVLIAELIRKINHPRVRMCFDTGHAHMSSLAGSPPVAEALEKCRDVVGYFHVHDNDAQSDSHQVPGLGNLPWEDFGRQMKKFPGDVAAMLELFETEAALEGQVEGGLAQKLRGWLALS